MKLLGFFGLFLLFFLIGQSKLFAQTAVGAGANYLIPNDQYEIDHEASYGGHFFLESRRFCNLWYGIRFDYFEIQHDSAASEFYEDAIVISPSIRYNFIKSDCQRNKVQFYLQLLLNISSIGKNDESGRLGLGSSGGVGVALPFELFRKCWSFELSAMYFSPNFILKSNGRIPLQGINLGASIAVKL